MCVVIREKINKSTHHRISLDYQPSPIAPALTHDGVFCRCFVAYIFIYMLFRDDDDDDRKDAASFVVAVW